MFEELSLHILDIAMNALAAGASTIQIDVYENRLRDWMILRVRDNGRGMDEATLNQVLAKALSTKENRKKPIGLGLALLRQTAEMCGGTFHVLSAPGEGTTVNASMKLSHVDRPPLGDLSSTILTLCVAHPKVDVQLHYHTNGQHLRFSSQQERQKGETQNELGRTQKTKRKSATAGCA